MGFLEVIIFLEGSLEVKLPTIWTDETAEVGKVREKKGIRKKIREEKESEAKKMQVREKAEKS
jgi:hypothetical protein